MAALACARLLPSCSDAQGAPGASPCPRPDAGSVKPPAALDAGPLPEFTLPESVAGIAIPDSRFTRAAAALVFNTSSLTLYNHCMRTFVFAALLFQSRGRRYDAELVFIGSALHDLGLVEAFMTPSERFELDGADAALRYLTEWGVPRERADVVWDAIALHTNGSIAARKAPEIAMVSAGAIMDAAGLELGELSADSVRQVLSAFPRLGFKQNAVETMIAICRKKPLGQLLHPFADVGRRHVDGFALPTIEDLILSSPFDE